MIIRLSAAGSAKSCLKARDSKIVRLSGVSQYFESGLVWLPKDASWLAGFETELLGFPGTRHDDQVDTVSQYLGHVRDRPSATFEYDFLGDDNEPATHDLIAERLGMHLNGGFNTGWY